MSRKGIIAAVLAATIIVLIAYTLVQIVQADAQPSQPPNFYEGVPLDATLLHLDKRALDEAYHAHLIVLFGVWLKGQAGDPTYFVNGLRVARRAYSQAAQQIARRERELLEAEQQKVQQRP